MKKQGDSDWKWIFEKAEHVQNAKKRISFHKINPGAIVVAFIVLALPLVYPPAREQAVLLIFVAILIIAISHEISQ